MTYSKPTVSAARVLSCESVFPNVFRLALRFADNGAEVAVPGQFYMLKAAASDVLLGRPLSVHRAERADGGTALTFLILKKGRGTESLCRLAKGERVSLLGPQGNTFPPPEQTCGAGQKLLFASGGIGVAPTAGFAATLPPGSYDFCASFKSGSYGLEHIAPDKLCVATEDGSLGVKGMLPAALSARELAGARYGAVYACGPEPMLAYVQKICAESRVPCFLSTESRMACGTGACLGCVVRTADGNRRCCADGPVFPGEKLLFPLSGTDSATPVRTREAPPKPTRPAGGEPPDLSVTIAGVPFKNPLIAASGTFGYGTEYRRLVDAGIFGGVCSKGLTLEARSGNAGVRLWETAGGLLNSIGLENPGIPHFIAHELPRMLWLGTVVIANLSGSSLDAYADGARLLDGTGVALIEVNISCPNVEAGGMAFGLDPDAAAAVTRAVREATRKPLMVKLSPNAPDVVAVAHAVREAGADALSLTNTFLGTALDIESCRPVFQNVRAGLSGPAIKPLALRIVYDTALSMRRLPKHARIPLVALGGISRWEDVAEFIMAGASAVQIGTGIFADLHSPAAILDGLAAFMARKGFRSIEDMRGIAL
ncbi:dihydroorotate dehydrogenase [Treponema endosymbiont of Eucomonympha sp.]|uniref:dihydroorotate dehydrogenase n=2 Tax=Treponema endosymbiont of Eucomonympha sp. TaxID=1580831 RepID=UPI000A8545F2|nr:dihydroorotate dehydrogenase [Treponema endosymbiont of Eucomonympha sp.]